MRLTQRSKNGIWFVDFRRDGRRARLSTGERDRRAAEQAAARLLHDALAAPEAAPAKPTRGTTGARRVTLAKALQFTWRSTWENSKSKREVKYRVQRLIRDLGDLRLDDLTYAKLRGIGEGWRQKGMSPASVNRYMSAISRAVTEMERLGDFTGNLRVPKWKEPAIKERYLSDEEEVTLLKAIEDRAAPAYPEWTYLQALVPFLIDTGLRLSEALGLTHDNLQGTRVVLRHGSTKSDAARSVPLTLRAQGAIAVMLAHPLHGKWERDKVSRRIANLFEELGMPDVTAHTLRHTCASRLVQRGVDLYKVKAWLGHATMATTERYAHLRPDELADVAHVLEPKKVRHP